MFVAFHLQCPTTELVPPHAQHPGYGPGNCGKMATKYIQHLVTYLPRKK